MNLGSICLFCMSEEDNWCWCWVGSDCDWSIADLVGMGPCRVWTPQARASCCFQLLCRILVKCKGPCVRPIITKQWHAAPQMFSYSWLPTLAHKKYLILILVEGSRVHPIGWNGYSYNLTFWEISQVIFICTAKNHISLNWNWFYSLYRVQRSQKKNDLKNPLL